MATERRAEAIWKGNLTEGSGIITKTGSGALGDLPITWAARTEQSDGKTSPEELIAAAHASCFSMELSHILNQAGSPPEMLSVSSTVTADRVEGALTVLSAALDVAGRVPGLDAVGFERAANQAKDSCPVSRALKGNVDLSVNARLES